MTEEKAKSLIGRKVRGFKFESDKLLLFTEEMNQYIDKIGLITCFDKCGAYCYFSVDFGDESFSYPTSLIEAHLVEEEPTKRISDLEKSDLNIDCMEIVSRTDYNKQDLIKVQDIINQNEQLKAEKAELVEFIKTYYRYLNLKDQEVAIKLLEKYGKTTKP